jgi:hypothetical protein
MFHGRADFYVADSFLKAERAHDEEPDAAAKIAGSVGRRNNYQGEQDGRTTPS